MVKIETSDYISAENPLFPDLLPEPDRVDFEGYPVAVSGYDSSAIVISRASEHLPQDADIALRHFGILCQEYKGLPEDSPEDVKRVFKESISAVYSEIVSVLGIRAASKQFNVMFAPHPEPQPTDPEA